MSIVKLKKVMLREAKDLKKSMILYHKKGVILHNFDIDYGICGNIAIRFGCYQCGSSGGILRGYFKKWKHFSGILAYPIKSNDEESPECYYMSSKKYKGRQYKMRMKLINYIIKCLKKDIMK